MAGANSIAPARVEVARRSVGRSLTLTRVLFPQRLSSMPIITTPELRSRATQDDILLAFADRLREHPLLNSQNVVVSDQSVPEDMPGGGFCVTVAPGPGVFPRELTAAASHAQVTEDGSVIIGVYTKILRDRKGRREYSLFGRKSQLASTADEVRRPSLATWKREILKLLLVKGPGFQFPPVDDDDPLPRWDFGVESWEPSRDGVPLCRDIPSPGRSTEVLDVPGFPGWIGLQLTFAIAWDWELYG